MWVCVGWETYGSLPKAILGLEFQKIGVLSCGPYNVDQRNCPRDSYEVQRNMHSVWTSLLWLVFPKAFKLRMWGSAVEVSLN